MFRPEIRINRMDSTPREPSSASGWSNAHEANKFYTPPQWSTAADLREALEKQELFVKTGVHAVDQLLGGGLLQGEVVELFGGPGSGKSMLCMAICAEQMRSSAASVLYVDTCRAACAETIYQLALRRDRSNRAECKQNLGAMLRLCDATHMQAVLITLESLIVELSQPEPSEWLRALRLVIVDSVFSVAMLEGQGGVPEAGALQLLRLQDVLRELSRRFRLAILVTNAAQTMGASNEPPGTSQPALGVAWQHMARVRIRLMSAAEAEAPGVDAVEPLFTGRAMLTKSPLSHRPFPPIDHPSASCVFSIGPPSS